MAKERRTNITGGTDKPATGAGKKTTVMKKPVRPATAMNAAVSGGNGNGGGYVRKKRRALDVVRFVVVLAILGGGGYFAWNAYQAAQEKERVAQEEKMRAAQQMDEERRARSAALEAERQKKLDAERQQREAEEQAKLAEAEALKRAEEEAAAAKRREEEDEKRKAAAVEAEKRAAEARTAKAVSELEELSAKARKLGKEGKFSEGATLITGKLATVKEDLPAEKAAPFVRLEKALDLFAGTVTETSVSPEATADNLYWFTMKDGRKIRGKVENDVGRDLVLIGNGGVKMTLLRENVDTKTAITQKEIDEEIAKNLADREAAATKGVDWFLAGIEALKGKKPEEARRLLSKAEETDRDIYASVQEQRARVLLASGIFNRSIGNQRVSKERLDRLMELYADTQVAKTYLESLNREAAVLAQLADLDNLTKLDLAKLDDPDKEKSEEGDEADDPAEEELLVVADAKEIHKEVEEAKRTLAPGATAVKGDSFLSQARTLEERAQNTENAEASNVLYREAASKLAQALAIYYDQRENPKIDQRSLEARITDANKRLYWCRKMQTL